MNRRVARLSATCALAALGAAGCTARETEVAPPASTTPQAAPASTVPVPLAATESERAEFARWFAAQPRVEINISNEGAKVMILKFNDFQCPPCAESHTAYMPIIKKAQAEHPGAVRFVMVDYPLEPECNKYVAMGPHAAACEAAAAVRLAWTHGRQEQMIDWLFANQFQLTPDVVREGARTVGQIPDFDAQYPAMLDRIRGDVELGHLLLVRQTPTFFVNGVALEGKVAPDYMDEAIQLELRSAAVK
jgi:protein-disulfide isomerase